MMKYLIVALALAVPANAELRSESSKTICANPDEIDRLLPTYKTIMRGPSGPDGQNIGELRVDPSTGGWFFIQILPSENTSCVILGGLKGMSPVDDKSI